MLDHLSLPRVFGTNTAGLGNKAFGRISYLPVSLIIASSKLPLPLFLTQELLLDLEEIFHSIICLLNSLSCFLYLYFMSCIVGNLQ